MTRSRPLTLSFVSTVVASLLVSAPARAQDAPPAAEAAVSSDEARARAREHFAKGVEHVDQREWALAISEFEQANAEVPHPLALYNVALARIELGDPLAAIAALERYLSASESADGEAERRERAAELLKSQKASIATLRFVTLPETARVEVDGAVVNPGAPLVTRPGRHVIRVFESGYEPQELEVSAAGGEARTLHFDLVKHRAPRAVVLRRVPDRDPMPVQARSDWRTPWGYVALGTGAVLGVAAGGLYFYNRGQRSEYEDERASLARAWPSAAQAELPGLQQRQSENDQRLDAIGARDAWAVGLGIGGGVLVATGAALLLSERAQAAPVVEGGRRGGKLSWRGRF